MYSNAMFPNPRHRSPAEPFLDTELASFITSSVLPDQQGYLLLNLFLVIVPPTQSFLQVYQNTQEEYVVSMDGCKWPNGTAVSLLSSCISCNAEVASIAVRRTTSYAMGYELAMSVLCSYLLTRFAVTDAAEAKGQSAAGVWCGSAE